MEDIIKSGSIIIAALAALVIAGIRIKQWLTLPSSLRVQNIKEWLLFAVTEAESQLGSGTGQLKLRYVYDWALKRFSWIAWIPFETFAGWVDEALEEMKELLKDERIRAYIEGE